MKITGQSLKGRKLTLKPVIRETTDKTLSTIKQSQYMALETTFVWSMNVAAMMIAPMKISDTPSIIHSIVMILLLSLDIPPNPMTIDFVGKK